MCVRLPIFYEGNWTTQMTGRILVISFVIPKV